MMVKVIVVMIHDDCSDKRKITIAIMIMMSIKYL